MTQTANSTARLIDGYLFAVYHTKSADAFKQTEARQALINELAGEILKAYEAKHNTLT